MASAILKSAGSFLLRQAAGALLDKGVQLAGKGFGYLMNKGADYLRNNKIVGPIFSKWTGYDSFRDSMANHGAMLADKYIPKTIPIPMGQSAGQSFMNGIKGGMAKTLINSGGGGAETPGDGMNPQKVPTQQATNPVGRVLGDPANSTFWNQ